MIETERLQLVPLSEQQLRLWLDNLPRLELQLACSYRAQPLEGAFAEAVRGQIGLMEGDPDRWQYYTFWLLLRKEDRVVVGSVGFKSPPQKGEVEIGYGLGPEFEGNGYMTEAVNAMCDWALRQPGLFHVIAETNVDGARSQNILRRCGFRLRSEGETLWWRL